MAKTARHSGTAGAKPCRLRRSVRFLWLRTNLTSRLFLAFLLVSLVPATVLFVAQYQHTRHNVMTVALNSLHRVADVQQRRLNLELQRLKDTFELVASRTQMRLSLLSYAHSGAAEELRLLRRILGDALVPLETIDGLWLRDAQGRLMAAVVKQASDGIETSFPVPHSGGTEPLLVVWPLAGPPRLWVNGPLELDGEHIGTLQMLARFDDLLAILDDFPCEDVGGETVLLLRDDQRGIRPLAGLCGDRTGRIETLQTAEWIPAGSGTLAAPGDPLYVGDQIVLLRPLDHALGDVAVHISARTLDRQLWRHTQLLLLLVCLALLLCLFMAMVLARMIARPVRVLNEASIALRQGDVSVRIRERFWGEFVELSRSFNRAVRMLAGQTEEMKREIEDRRLSQQQLANLANTDNLTGLINRRHFMSLLEQIFAPTAAQEHAGALLYIDLDGFKPINDRLGHAAGDTVLQVIAGRLRHLLRDGDYAARLGGDEFALLLLEGGGRALEPEKIAHRVEEQLSLPIKVRDEVIQVGCSVGVVRTVSGDDPQEILSRADKAMYQVKHERRRSG